MNDDKIRNHVGQFGNERNESV